jgi:hypothetical protein
MSTILRVPLQVGMPQTFSINLNGVAYQITLRYRDAPDGGWTMDIDDDSGDPLLYGVPLVTGANLLAQYQHLGFAGGFYVQTTSDPDAVPTFDNLGDDGQLYWVNA